MTGGAGFIGSHLTDRLLKLGHNVVVLDDLSKGQTANLEGNLDNTRLKFAAGDIRHRKIVRKVLRDCSLVFHLAANSDVRSGAQDTKIHFEQNLVATRALLECMKNSPSCRRLIFTSTSTVYGEPTEIPTSETYGPLKPISMYGASKLGCEGIISAYGHLFGIESTIFRLANIVGPKNDHSVVYDITRKIFNHDKDVQILGDGKQKKSYLYIDDCVEALLMGINLRHRETEVFNVGSEDALEVSEIVRIIEHAIGRHSGNLSFQDDGEGRGWPGDVKEMLLDCSKLRSRGWKPRYESQGAVKATVKEFLGAGMLDSGLLVPTPLAE